MMLGGSWRLQSVELAPALKSSKGISMYNIHNWDVPSPLALRAILRLLNNHDCTAFAAVSSITVDVILTNELSMTFIVEE